MLKDFGALPTEKRAREMTDRDYLYCILNEWLDSEDRLSGMCPECRSRATEKRCTMCGALMADIAADVNESFDAERYERMFGRAT